MKRRNVSCRKIDGNRRGAAMLQSTSRRARLGLPHPAGPMPRRGEPAHPTRRGYAVVTTRHIHLRKHVYEDNLQFIVAVSGSHHHFVDRGSR